MLVLSIIAICLMAIVFGVGGLALLGSDQRIERVFGGGAVVAAAFTVTVLALWLSRGVCP